jgi:hypothetical protein
MHLTDPEEVLQELFFAMSSPFDSRLMPLILSFLLSRQERWRRWKKMWLESIHGCKSYNQSSKAMVCSCRGGYAFLLSSGDSSWEWFIKVSLRRESCHRPRDSLLRPKQGWLKNKGLIFTSHISSFSRERPLLCYGGDNCSRIIRFEWCFYISFCLSWSPCFVVVISFSWLKRGTIAPSNCSSHTNCLW